MTGDGIDLTPEQQAVVEQPLEACVLVTAGAGAGKTLTLVERVRRLITEYEVDPQDILVLSFSRAAVRRLRDSLRTLEAGRAVVRAQTFDAWALSVLSRVDGGIDRQASFDERIRRASAAMRDGLADDLHETLRHVVVDEVQDLVGDRRLLVQELLGRYECGFTVVGDNAQSIYGFQVSNPADRAHEAGRFVEWLRETIADDLVELALTENFRARSAQARLALGYGPMLRSVVESGSGHEETALFEELRSVLRTDALEIGALDEELVHSYLRNSEGTGAILCRTNGQALVASELLHEGKVPHRLQRSAGDIAAPAWIGMLLRRADSRLLAGDVFEDMVGDLSICGLAEPSDLWRLLRRTSRGAGPTIDLGDLRRAIADRRLPDELVAPPEARLVVSSFHRAKGLEFDRVVVADPDRLTNDATDVAEEARLLYVAMTRPRDGLLWLKSLRRWDIRVHERTDRWARFGPQRWQRWGIEVGSGDVHTEDPAGTMGFTGDPIGIQNRLETDVAVGDPVILQRTAEESLEAWHSPPYLIIHRGSPLGLASSALRRDLYLLLKSGPRLQPRSFPSLIEGLRIEAVETVVGSTAAGQLAGLGEYGVWLAPRLVGLGRFTYDKQGERDA